MTGDQLAKTQLVAEASAIERAADVQHRNLTPGEVVRLAAIYRQLDIIEADAESSAGWIG